MGRVSENPSHNWSPQWKRSWAWAMRGSVSTDLSEMKTWYLHPRPTHHTNTSFNSRFPLSPPIVLFWNNSYMFQIHNLKFIPPLGRRHQRLRPSCLRSRNGSECHVVKRWKTSFLLFSLSKQLPWVKCSHEAVEGAVGKIDERRHVDSEMATRVSLPCSSKET